MIHLSFIREQPDKVRKGARNKGEIIDLDSLLNLDSEHRSLLDSLMNSVRNGIGFLRKSGRPREREKMH